MKRAMIFLAAACIVAIAAAAVPSKDVPVPRPRFYRPVAQETTPDVVGFGPRANTIASVDTYCIVWFDFEQMNWQGWDQVDNTAQWDTFTHVDDFAGLGGGSHGRLVPIEGEKSLWFGTRGGASQASCLWPPGAAGYGNGWSQFIYAHITTGIEWGDTATITVSYKLSCDTEEGHDYFTVCYGDHSGCDYVLAEYTGVVDTVASHTFDYYQFMCFNFYFKFESDQSVSDEDGLIDTDGGAILDSITVYIETPTDSFLQDFEDFESYEPGEAPASYWYWNPDYGFGTYSGLANNLVDRDPCHDNFATQVIFYNGSPFMSPDYPWQGLYTTPHCTGAGGINEPCQDEMVVSPWIDLGSYSSNCDENIDSAIPPGELAGLSGFKFIYQVYLDNPIENLVFHTWRVRSMIDGCPQPWREEPLIMYYGDDELYHWFEHDISGMVESDVIQVAVGVIDMCSVWYGIYGDCAEHTPAPWFDNIRIQRYETVGPQWAYQGADLFQDNFPSTDDMESWVRADMAADISPPSWPDIVPGDSAVVSCWAPNGGELDTLPTGEARVYFHCNVVFLGTDGKPDLSGAQMEGNYGTYVGEEGDWTVLLCEPARISGGAAAPDRYCIDLNDSLFTRGYMIQYYFKAFDMNGVSTTLIPEHPPDPCSPERCIFEFTCLPTLRVVPHTLYVDDFDGRVTPEGLVETYMSPSFEAIVATPGDYPDTYDINQPSAMAGNSLGSRARLATFKAAYDIVYWDSGDLADGTVISAYSGYDKSDDITFLKEWLDVTVYPMGGLLVLGDNVATDLIQYSDGIDFMENWCGVSLEHSSFFEMTGGQDGDGIINPQVSGVPATPLDGHQFYLFGGCPSIADFDVLRPVGDGFTVMKYPVYGDSASAAGVFSEQDNATGDGYRTEWFGFSFMRIRDDRQGTLRRNEFLNDCGRRWFHGIGASPNLTGDEVPAVTSLAAVYPNPFNPVTRVSFSLKAKGHVSLRIYDVSGRLVRILIDEVRDAGSYEAVWDGTNDRGRATASGIYFCRMESEDYERTVKMVQLR